MSATTSAQVVDVDAAPFGPVLVEEGVRTTRSLRGLPVHAMRIELGSPAPG
jgi:hypothetical protein